MVKTDKESMERSFVRGVFLPIITPFFEKTVDFESYERLLAHYLDMGIDGLVLLGTTGESPTVTPDERDQLVARTLELVDHRIGVYLGVGGNATESVVNTVRQLDRFDLDGYLVVCPYYNRPPQDGLAAHFRAVAETTERTIIIYNIPYRTGVNLENDTLLQMLRSSPNVRAVKDSCGSLTQTVDLIARAPAGFSVMTGEDHLFFTALANGANGGILASAHLATSTFVGIERALRSGELATAREMWKLVADPLVQLLFAEPNPMPIKHCLWRLGLIRSPECRLPLTSISDHLAQALDDALETFQSNVTT